MKIFYLNGPNAGISEDLRPPSVSIGRESDNDIQLLQANVSRYHARLDYYNGKWTLRDLCSTNGSTVNGEKVVNPVILKDGDVFSIGDQEICFGFHNGETSPESSGMDFSLPLEATARHDFSREELSEQGERARLYALISRKLISMGGILLILFLLFGALTFTRFIKLNREMRAQEEIRTLSGALEKEKDVPLKEAPIVLRYEIKHYNTDGLYRLLLEFRRSYVEIVLDDTINRRHFATREAYPDPDLMDELRLKLQQTGFLELQLAKPASISFQKNAPCFSLQVFLGIDNRSNQVQWASSEKGPDSISELGNLQKVLYSFIRNCYAVDPDPAHIPAILEEAVQQCKQGDLLLSEAAQENPQKLKEAALLYRRALRTFSQFEQPPEVWENARKNLAECESRLQEMIRQKSQLLEEAGANQDDESARQIQEGIRSLQLSRNIIRPAIHPIYGKLSSADADPKGRRRLWA